MSLGLISDAKIQDLCDVTISSAQFFRALGLVWAYQHMIHLADRGTRTHAEVNRAPELREMLLNHFMAEYKQHINVESNQIFSPTAVGSFSSLREWQNAGYHTRRSTRNYPRRLRAWKAIYDETDLIVKRKAPKRAPRDTSSADAHKYGPYANLGRVKDADGNVVTYEIVIQRRNTHYSATKKLVPFWVVLNYGTNGIRGAGAGYPIIPGIFFIEGAEKQINRYMDRAIALYANFALAVLTRDKQHASVADAYNWTKKRGTTFRYSYLDSASVAREIAEIF